jgi:hypothetical protein
LRVTQVQLYERDVRLRLPFRFGVTTLTEAPQGFARVRVECRDGTGAWGAAAEVLAPKWFDKRTDLSNEQNFEQLRIALGIAREAYLSAARSTAFGVAAGAYRSVLRAGAARGLNALTASFGAALLDRAVLDALCRARGVSVADALRANLTGLEPEWLAPDLRGFDAPAWLSSLRAMTSVHARHTVGMSDALGAQEPRVRLDDGLPETLEEVVAEYGHRYFKIKVCGNLEEDLARLQAVAAVLDQHCPDYAVTLDGNEQYESLDGIQALWARLGETGALRRFRANVLLIEQPLRRSVALETDVSALCRRVPVIVDESDDCIEAFLQARACGYRGVSSKTCKGIYKSILNAARCRAWNAQAPGAPYCMTGEDLTCQAGIAVQQDLALVSLLGIEHVERNGHHYVHGMRGLPQPEQRAFLRAHPDLYRDHRGVTCLRIEQGRIGTDSLWGVGYASGAEPDWSAMRTMREPGEATA